MCRVVHDFIRYRIVPVIHDIVSVMLYRPVVHVIHDIVSVMPRRKIIIAGLYYTVLILLWLGCIVLYVILFSAGNHP